MDFDFKKVLEETDNCWIIFWWQDLFTNCLKGLQPGKALTSLLNDGN